MATTNTSSRLKEELLAEERAYLAAVQAGDGDGAARLTAEPALVVSPQGAMKVGPQAIRRMMSEHDATREYALDETSAEVVEVTPDVAIISYRLRTTTPGAGTSEAVDTDVWVRTDGAWKCALHTEIPAA